MHTDDSDDHAVAAAYTSAFRAHFRAITAYVARRLASGGVHDVVSEVFLVAWRRWDDAPNADEDILPWLYGVARNVVRNEMRSANRVTRLHAKLAVHRSRESSEPLAQSTLSVHDALGQVGEADREILQLAGWEGLDRFQIGRVLDCSPNAAAIRLHRARKRLQAAFDATDGSDAADSLQKRSARDGHTSLHPKTTEVHGRNER